MSSVSHKDAGLVVAALSERRSDVGMLFEQSGGNVAKFASRSELTPIMAVKQLVAAGEIEPGDLRHEAAWSASVEARRSGSSLTGGKDVLEGLQNLEAAMKDRGWKQDNVQMRAIANFVEASAKESGADRVRHGKVAAVMEDMAMSSRMPEDLKVKALEFSATLTLSEREARTLERVQQKKPIDQQR